MLTAATVVPLSTSTARDLPAEPQAAAARTATVP
jgi:hypothetical protein